MESNVKTQEPVTTIKVKRNQVMISCNSTPSVYLAQEQITWQGGSVQISGIGGTRSDALNSLDAEFDALKKILGNSDS